MSLRLVSGFVPVRPVRAVLVSATPVALTAEVGVGVALALGGVIAFGADSAPFAVEAVVVTEVV
jgi:hypothetical protein